MRCVYGGFSCSWGDRFKTVILINVVIGSAQIIRECCKSSWSIVKWVLSSCQNGRSFVEFFYAFRFRFKQKHFCEIICRVVRILLRNIFFRSDHSCNSSLALRNETTMMLASRIETRVAVFFSICSNHAPVLTLATGDLASTDMIGHAHSHRNEDPAEDAGPGSSHVRSETVSELWAAIDALSPAFRPGGSNYDGEPAPAEDDVVGAFDVQDTAPSEKVSAPGASLLDEVALTKHDIYHFYGGHNNFFAVRTPDD